MYLFAQGQIGPEPFARPDEIGTDPTYGHLTLDAETQRGLGIYYILVAVLNLAFAFYWYHSQRNRKQTFIWTTVAGVFLLHAVFYLMHRGWVIPVGLRNAVDGFIGPV